MHTYFEPEDVEAFEAAKDLLIRRSTGWAERQGQRVDPLTLSAALDFRHHSIDGRWGYWTTGLVEEFLLSHLPRTLSATAHEAAGMPEDLRVFVRYLHATGLADATGSTLTELDAAITKAAAEFAAAMTDERNFGLAKFWVMAAINHGVDPADHVAMNRFAEQARAGEIGYDDDVLTHIAARHAEDGGGRPERAVAQLPVSLPAETELAAVAGQAPVVARLRALVDWIGDGRALTTTGNIKLADARELVRLLDTGDTIDPQIGDQVFRTQSSAELPALTTLVELAKKIRLVRVVKNRLVRIAKSAPLLRDSLALWTDGFDALPELGLLPRPGAREAGHTVLLDEMIDLVLPDILHTIYGLPEPVPVVRLAETVWLACTEVAYLDELDPDATAVWREGVGEDVRRLFAELAEFGALELTVAEPDPLFQRDLDAPEMFPPDTAARLRAALSSGPVELVSLTPLATRAVRGRMVKAGRYAPLVGELSDAGPTPLLGMIVDHYTPEAAEAEIAAWLENHGGQPDGLPQLLEGVRACPFRARAAMMLDVLARTMPDRPAFLRGLRADQQLGPIVAQLLLEDGEVSMDELGPDEGLRAMAEQFIHLLEVAGPDAVVDALAEMSADEARELMVALLASGHPDHVGLDELRQLFTTRRPGRATVHPLAGVSRSRRGPGKGRKRRS